MRVPPVHTGRTRPPLRPTTRATNAAIRPTPTLTLPGGGWACALPLAFPQPQLLILYRSLT